MASSVSRRARNVVRRLPRLAQWAALLALGGAAALVAGARWLGWVVPPAPAAVAVLLLAVVATAVLALIDELRRPRVADLDEAARAAQTAAFGWADSRPEPDEPAIGRRATWEVETDVWAIALAGAGTGLAPLCVTGATTAPHDRAAVAAAVLALRHTVAESAGPLVRAAVPGTTGEFAAVGRPVEPLESGDPPADAPLLLVAVRGRTTMAALRRRAAGLRQRGGTVVGVVLFDALPTGTV